MQFTSLKIGIAATWLLAIGALGVFGTVSTMAGWITLVGFGLMPSIFMLRAWRQPSQSISEAIQAEIRR
jgi:hypothetical protein